MMNKHRKEEDDLHNKLKSDEESKIMAEIEALTKVENNYEEKKRILEEEMQRRNEMAATESEKTEIAHEHMVQLKNLEDSLKQDRIQSQKQLSKIHDDMRAKLRAAKADMKKKQTAQTSAAKATLEKIKAAVDQKQSVKVEGVDLKSIEAGIINANSNPTARQQALQSHHNTAQQDLIRSQREAEMRLIDDAEKEKQRQFDALDNKFNNEYEDEAAKLEQKLANDLAQATSEEQREVIRTMHEAALKELNQRLQGEKVREKARLQAALAKQKRVRELRLKREHEVALHAELDEQRKEKDSMDRTVLKQKEIEALTRLLTPENRRKAKAIIERLVKPRQTKEITGLLNDNYKEMNSAINENLTKAFEEAETRR